MNTSDLDDLYQHVILSHSRHPQNFGNLEDGDGGGPIVRVRGDNPSCGDEIEVAVRIGAGGSVEDIRFKGQGCAISQASASLMTLGIKGKTREEADALCAAFHEMLQNETAQPSGLLGDLQFLQSVRRFPQRVKCATLAWRAVEEALRSAPPKRVV